MGILVLVFFIIFIVLLYQKRMQAGKIDLANSEKDHQKRLLQASLEIAEQERQTIAANLHDEVGLNLSILKINFSKLEQANQDPETSENILATSYALIENSMEIIRTIHRDIRPRTLMTLGLVAAIRELAREINVSRAAEVVVHSRDTIVITDKNIEMQMHRLIKEVLNNTLRHAKPLFIEINIEYEGNNLRVTILHNGMGITTERIKELARNSRGLGLKSIFTRTELLNGSVEYEDEPYARVILKCPLV